MEKDILLIDGFCALCTRFGKFIQNRVSKQLKISELESEEGQEILLKYKITTDSVVLIRNGKPFIYSAAAIRCLLYMKWYWKWIYPIAWIIPSLIRDFVYKLISKRRFRET